MNIWIGKNCLNKKPFEYIVPHPLKCVGTIKTRKKSLAFAIASIGDGIGDGIGISVNDIMA